MNPSQRLSQSVFISPASAMSALIMRPKIVIIRPPTMLVSFPNARPHIGISGSTTPPVYGTLTTVPLSPRHVFLDSPTDVDIARTHALELRIHIHHWMVLKPIGGQGNL